MKIVHKTVLSSTQDYAKDLLPTYTNDVLVVADVQTAGRGRLRGRLWVSDKGNFHGSFIVDIAKIGYVQSDIGLLNSRIIHAVRQTIIDISRCDDISIKLPNDIFFNNKKMAGVLIEVFYPFAIIGIGINLVSSPIEKSTSIKDAFCISINNTDLNLTNNLYKNIIKYSSLC